MLTPERWAIVENLFHDALARPADSRGAFLDSSCGGDAELRREVESLIAADSAARSRASLAPEVAADWAAGGLEPLIGRRIDSYTVVSLLGAGGMGEVFLAEDSSLGRRVALKLLPAPFAADEARLRRFTEEARAASALNHPNIITVHHVGAFEGRQYLATEYIDGETLRDRIARGPIDPLEAVDIALQSARALDAAHAAGIVHRDIKPENLMIRRDGYLKVVDFGLAKLSPDERLAGGAPSAGGAASITRAGAVLGTANYMAPEQKTAASVDARADLYSLAVVLHEMLTGALPRAAGAPSGPAGPAAKLPKPLEPILRRGLAGDPLHRYQSAAELVRELETAARVLEAAPGRRRLVAASAAVAGIVAGIAGAVVLLRLLPSAPVVGSVAVLPFTAIDPSRSDQQHLQLAMTDALIARLGEARGLTVAPGSTIRHFAGSSRSPTDIGRELGVAAVLTGSLMRADDRLQVTAQVLRVSDGERLWTGRFDEPVGGIFSIQDGIGAQVASALALDVDADALSRVRRRETRNSEAYDLYARARQQWARRTPDAIRQAIDLFERALAIDPDFPQAWAGMANAYSLTASGLLPAERFPKAREAALKALALDERLAEAHNALGFIGYKWEWQWEAAERAFERAIALEPNYALAHQWYGEFLSVIGRHEEGLAALAQAQALDPYSTAIRVDRAAALTRASRAADAVEVLQAALQENPRAAALHNRLFHAFWMLGREDDAFEAMVRSRSLSGATSTDVETMRRTYRAGGLPALLRADLAHLLEVDRTGRSQGYYSRVSVAAVIAYHYAALGEADRALAWLEEGTRRRDDTPLTIRTMWYWDPYRSDPRFQAVERLIAMP